MSDLVRVVGVAVAAAVLAGCSAPGASEPRSGTEERDGRSVASAVSEEAVPASAVVGPLIRFPVELSREEEPAAEISGVLEFDNDCLYLRNAEVEERYVVVWPAGSDWDAEEQVVHFVRGPDLPVGGTYFDGGGYDDLERVARAFGPEARALLTRCTAGAAAAIGVVGGI